MKYFIIAGEASGDIHGAQLIRSIKRLDAYAKFSFFGGDLMADACSTQPVVHYRDMAYMGFIEVIKHLRTILGFMDTAKKIIDTSAPDAIILIDYPSFNLKIAKYAHSRGIDTYYFISPKVWAWKEYRVKQIKKYITKLFSILPFETEFFARHHYAVQYVGNPTVKEISDAKRKFCSDDEFRKRNSLSDKPILALVPGSRKKEILDNLPVMVKAANRFPQFQMVIAGAPSIDKGFYSQVLSAEDITTEISVLQGQSFQLIASSKVALVTSGTATLETAVLGTPQVVCYRMGGSRLLYLLYKLLLKVKYVSLPNLIVGREIIPELLLHKCNEDRIASEIRLLTSDTTEYRNMIDGYCEMLFRLGDNDCTDTAAHLLIDSLSKDID